MSDAAVTPAGPARPTLEMVAAAAGVSRGTASRALNGGINVSRPALDAVLKAAEELGYRPNLAARSLALGRSDSIGLVVSETDERLFAEPFFAAVVRGVHAELAAAGRQLVLTFSQSEEERAQLSRFAAGRHLDGVILISLHGDDPLPRSLVADGIPVVMAGRGSERDRRAGVWWVQADNRGGSRTRGRAPARHRPAEDRDDRRPGGHDGGPRSRRRLARRAAGGRAGARAGTAAAR